MFNTKTTLTDSRFGDFLETFTISSCACVSLRTCTTIVGFYIVIVSIVFNVILMIIVKKWQNELRDYHEFHISSETTQTQDTADQLKERRIETMLSKVSMTSKRSRHSIISVVATPDLLHEAANQHLTWYQRSVFCVLLFNTIKCIVGVCILVDIFTDLNWMIKISTIIFFMITIVQAISSLLVAIYLENKMAVVLMAVIFSINLFSVVVLWSYYTDQTTS